MKDCIQEYYGDNPQSPVDGVIAIDLVGFEYILEGLGSIVVEDYNVEVSSDSFREKIYEIRANSAFNPFNLSVFSDDFYRTSY